MARKLRLGKKAHRRTLLHTKKAPHRGNKGKPPLPTQETLLLIFKTVRHFFPRFWNWLDAIPDPRKKHLIIYPLRALLIDGIFMFLFHLGARRCLRYDFNSEHGLDNFSAFSRCPLETLPHPDTLIYLLGGHKKRKKLSPEHTELIRTKMLRALLRKKVLYRYRLFRRDYLIAIDGTGYVASLKRHCPYCLHATDTFGRTCYYHKVLEAKLICSNGMVFSIATEFIYNEVEDGTQDSELKAFYRLISRLRHHFPQLPICLLLDSLYLNQNVLRFLRELRDVHYIITFKEGSLPLAFREFETLHREVPEQSLVESQEEATFTYRWVSELEHEGEKFNGFECVEKRKNGDTLRFVWATDLHVNKATIKELARGGRLRWKIENEGFRTQKHGGYRLEHVYTKDWNAATHFYFFLQIAHILMQLIQYGSLLPAAPERLFGSIARLALVLLEAWRTAYIEPAILERLLTGRCQIRLRSP